MDAADFQKFKAIGLALTFCAIALLQSIAPYRGTLKEVLRGWRVNLSLAAINTIVLALLCGGCVCTLAAWATERRIGIMNEIDLSATGAIILSVIILDFVAYAWHRASHAASLLWRFHAVHHSDATMDATTAFRFHAGELLSALVVRIAVVLLFGIPVLGILAFEIIFGFFNCFVHGNVRIPSVVERALGTLSITPSLHRHHHSRVPSEQRSNFGTILSLWDRLGGTFAPSTSERTVEMGLASGHIDPTSLASLLKAPATFQRI